MRSTMLLVMACVLLIGCAARQETGGLSYTADEAWLSETPASESRLIQYSLPGDGDETTTASLVVYHFGSGGAGNVEGNLQRWKEQFESDDLSADPVTRHENRDGMDVHEIEVSGTYVAAVRPGADEHHNDAGYAMLAAVLATANGPYYVKLVGPRATVASWKASYRRFLDSIKAVEMTTDPGEEASHP